MTPDPQTCPTCGNNSFFATLKVTQKVEIFAWGGTGQAKTLSVSALSSDQAALAALQQAPALIECSCAECGQTIHLSHIRSDGQEPEQHEVEDFDF